jgi:hypothetical protein
MREDFSDQGLLVWTPDVAAGLPLPTEAGAAPVPAPIVVEPGSSTPPEPPGAPVKGGLTRMPAISTFEIGTENVMYRGPGVLTAAGLIGLTANG